jgi:hypothetical protein
MKIAKRVRPGTEDGFVKSTNSCNLREKEVEVGDRKAA